MAKDKIWSILMWTFIIVFILICLIPVGLFIARELYNTNGRIADLYAEHGKGLDYDEFIKGKYQEFGFLYTNWNWWILFLSSGVGLTLIVIIINQIWKLKLAEITELKKQRIKQFAKAKLIFTKEEEEKENEI